ncbi:MAG: ABC transporter permease, partial [Pseudomonadota bacterium]
MSAADGTAASEVVDTTRPVPAAPERNSRLSPLNQRRVANFRANRRALWSLRIFSVLFLISLFAEVVANDRPLLMNYNR